MKKVEFDVSSAIPQVQEYCDLRVKCGLSPKTEQAANLGLPRSLYSVVIRDQEGKLIGMGRLVGDLGTSVQVVDIAVDPDHQGKGLSHEIMKPIMEFIEANVPESCFVNLFADVDFLYQKYGFRRTKAIGMARV